MSMPLMQDTIATPARPAAMGDATIQLNQVLHEVRPLVERVAERKRITVAFDASDELPTAARHELPLMRLCYLLIVRAITVTPPYGTVRVSGSMLGAGDVAGPGRWIQVTVWDAGTGITPSDFQRVFQDFEPRDSTAAEGCYGVTVSSRLAHLPTARLSMNTRWGDGCTVTVKLPAA